MECMLDMLAILDKSSTNLYWSVLSTLASQAEYFRAVGRDAAQQRCKQLADFAWDTLLPAELTDTRRHLDGTSALMFYKDFGPFAPPPAGRLPGRISHTRPPPARLPARLLAARSDA